MRRARPGRRRTEPGRCPLSRPRSRWSLALWTALGLLLASEIGLRVLTDYNSRWNMRLGAHKQFDPVVQFRNKPFYDWGNGIRTNEYGYQAPQPLSVKPPPGVLRILYLGDSITVTPLVGAYPQQVEPMLREALGVGVETVNAAVPGYSSQNARLLFENELSRFDAQYFVVYLGWNDLGQFGPEGLPYKLDAAGYHLSPLQRLLTNIYSIRFLYAAQRVLAHSRGAVSHPMSPADQALYDRYVPTHFYDNLRAILKLAKSRYPNVYIMNLATITNDDPTEWELRTAHFPVGMDENMHKLNVLVGKYNQAVQRVAAEEGVPMIDLYDRFDSREARQYFTDSCHMNRDGASVIAHALVDAIRVREAQSPSVPGEVVGSATN